VVILAASIAGVQSYVAAQNQTTPVLVLAHGVGWGHRLTEGDLAVYPETLDEHVEKVEPWEVHDVVGQFAARDLTYGKLLTHQDLSNTRPPGAGEVVVAVLLKPGASPAMGVRADAKVLLTPTATANSTTPAIAPVSGVVLDSGAPSSDGSVVVDVIVNSVQAGIASPAGTGQVVLSLLPERSQ
jgi:hypothetical protein